MTSQTGEQTVAIHILTDISRSKNQCKKITNHTQKRNFFATKLLTLVFSESNPVANVVFENTFPSLGVFAFFFKKYKLTKFNIF